MKAYGKRVWLIPDAFLGSESKNELVTHEAVCVINTGESDARLDFTLLFEDRDPVTGFSAVCGAGRTNHVRLDKIRGKNGEMIPYDTPYAILVESSEPVVVQYSRLDASHAELALMTTIAWSND
ncbi:MAG: hypothetical protein LUI01_03055 [Firmicutes bacterium]|nr:hypothetical protein [Bacillota bacterium]